MASLLERKLIVVTGKGGTGKTTVACALGLLGARRGLRTIVVELGDQHRLPGLFAGEQGHSGGSGQDFAQADQASPDAGVEVELEPNLWSTSIDPDRALLEWLHSFAGRISARLLASSSTFHYFAAAAPGAKELVSMIKVRELCVGPRRDRGKTSEQQRRDPHGQSGYDLVVLDAPATGHALAMLCSPQTFSSIVRVGPLAEHAQEVSSLLGDRARCAYVAVAQGTEMAVTETLELEEGLRRGLDRDLDAVLVNCVLPRRFTREEMARIDELAPDFVGDAVPGSAVAGVVERAVRAARTTYERTRLQQSQIARLRRQRFADGRPPSVITIPFMFTPNLDLAAVREISAGLERRL
ncbi:MAG: ArsA-related P-loop ATPase [Solirubrobacteraceae bacterium]